MAETINPYIDPEGMYEAEQRGVQAQAHAISRLFDVVEAAPFLWGWGDGEGGSVYTAITAEAIKRGLPGGQLKYTPNRSRKDMLDLLSERDGWFCRYCLIPLAEDPDVDGPQIDHVIPKARGGTDHLHNLVLACSSCNRRKGTKSAQEFVGGRTG